MRECIPEKELPASLIKKGPIPIGGVGGVTVFASGEYLVAMDTTEGKAQQLQGVTVPVITGDFPSLDITAAVSAVKSGDRKNSKLRNCKFPPQVGGVIDCLIGIQYNQLQPKVVHMLPSGLAIYETKLAPHFKGMNYVLGGPHTSFDSLLATSGNAAFLLNEFISGLTNWRTSGPPSLSQFMMPEFEVEQAIRKNMMEKEVTDYQQLISTEIDEFKTCLDSLNCQEEEKDNQFTQSVDMNMTVTEINKLLEEYQDITCIDCGYEPLGESSFN